LSDQLPAPLARQVGERSEIVIRTALPADAEALQVLAQLVDRHLPAPPVLLATTDGVVVAALSTVTGAVVTDPFRATADLVELLRLRSAQLHELEAA
jgi:hypothetical protein